MFFKTKTKKMNSFLKILNRKPKTSFSFFVSQNKNKKNMRKTEKNNQKQKKHIQKNTKTNNILKTI